jgi:hypothetical protein
MKQFGLCCLEPACQRGHDSSLVLEGIEPREKGQLLEDWYTGWTDDLRLTGEDVRARRAFVDSWLRVHRNCRIDSATLVDLNAPGSAVFRS